MTSRLTRIAARLAGPAVSRRIETLERTVDRLERTVREMTRNATAAAADFSALHENVAELHETYRALRGELQHGRHARFVDHVNHELRTRAAQNRAARAGGPVMGRSARRAVIANMATPPLDVDGTTGLHLTFDDEDNR